MLKFARSLLKYNLSFITQSFTRRRERAFANLQGVHENMWNANMTDLSPLAPGHFVIVQGPGKREDSPELILGQGM